MKKILFFLIFLICENYNIIDGKILVKPTAIWVKDVVLGEEFTIKGSEKYLLKIINSNHKTDNYIFSILSCEESGQQPRLTSYSDIPDSNWFILKQDEMKVDAGKEGYFRNVCIKIPKKREYYGKKYQGIIKVQQKQARGLNIEVIIPLFIETEAKPASFLTKVLGIFKRKKRIEKLSFQEGHLNGDFAELR